MAQINISVFLGNNLTIILHKIDQNCWEEMKKNLALLTFNPALFQNLKKLKLMNQIPTSLYCIGSGLAFRKIVKNFNGSFLLHKWIFLALRKSIIMEC